MQLDHSQVWPYAIAVLVVLLIYRRLRRSFGRQKVRPVRMKIRIGILILLAASLTPTAMRSAEFLFAELGGVAAGAALGLWGAQRTRYQTHGGSLHYIPHTYTGIAVSLLFLGRVVYRMVALYSMDHSIGQVGLDSAQSFGSPAMVNSPLTVGALFVVIGYYVCYYSLVLWKSRRIGPSDLEAPATDSQGAASPPPM
jgi:hypothetical protein